MTPADRDAAARDDAGRHDTGRGDDDGRHDTGHDTGRSDSRTARRTLVDGTPVTLVHVVRHGEVDNPERILYGRLPGYHLSERGHQMAQATADHLAARDIVYIASSPLERAQETAAPIAAAHGLDVALDDNLIESHNILEGLVVNGATLRSRWRHLLNPLRPSWGEPYRQVAARMQIALAETLEHAEGHEGVMVSHQLPVWMLRRSIEGRRLVHHPRRRECSLASVTTVLFHGTFPVRVMYAEPAAHLLAGAVDVTGASREAIPG
jgi:broad specificity phosphatase PhoE